MANKDTQYSESVEMTATPAITPIGKWLSVAVILVRIVVGVTFIFSGLVKLIDPVGTMYKIDDYLAVMNMTALQPLSIIASVALALAEFILGINTLLGSYLRTTPKLLLAFMTLMTPLTLYLAIANPIADCGCFGDAVILTNWQTFAKNVVLLLLVLFLFKYYTKAKSVFHREVQALTVIWGIVYAAFVVWFAFTYMPILDFRPYKLGTDIRAAYYGDDMPDTEYQFVYEREGVQQTFALDNLPDESQGWTFVERKQVGAKLVVKATSAADYFVVYDGNKDVTEDILEQDGYVFIMLSPNLAKANDNHIDKIHELYDYCLLYGYPFYAVTASTPAEIDEWLDNTGGEYLFLFMDKTSIVTIARGNPYMLILKDGVIYHKYPISQLPEEAQLDRPFDQVEYHGTQAVYNERARVLFLVLALVVPILVLYFTERVALFALRRFRRKREEKRQSNEETNINK